MSTVKCHTYWSRKRTPWNKIIFSFARERSPFLAKDRVKIPRDTFSVPVRNIITGDTQNLRFLDIIRVPRDNFALHRDDRVPSQRLRSLAKIFAFPREKNFSGKCEIAEIRVTPRWSRSLAIISRFSEIILRFPEILLRAPEIISCFPRDNSRSPGIIYVWCTR